MRFPDHGSRAAAEAFFERYLAEADARLAWFLDEADRAGVAIPRDTTASLENLTRFVVDRLEQDEDVPFEPPVWTEGRRYLERWTVYGAALVDGLTWFVAALYRERTGADWTIDESDPKSVYYRQPVIGHPGVITPPWAQVIGIINGVHLGRRSVSDLVRIVEGELQRASTVTDRSHLDERVHVTLEEPYPGWDFHLGVDEWAEDTIGTEAFDAIPQQVAGLPGVTDVHTEDREVLLVSTDGSIDGAELRDAVQALFDEAAPPRGASP